MNELPTFNEWRKGRPAMRRPAKKPSVKNPSIDAFVKSVDSLKKDMDQLDAVEKKVKLKPKPEEKPDDKSFDSFKDYKKKRDSEEKVKDDDDEVDDRPDEIEPEGDRHKKLLLPSRKIPKITPTIRGKVRRPTRPEAGSMED